MSRKTTTHGGRRRLPAVTRKQWRNRTRDLQDAVRQTKHQLAGAEEFMAGQALRIADLEEQLAQQAADAVDVSVLRQQLDAAQQANTRLGEANIALTARLQNLEAFTIPVIGDRDTTEPDDQNTEPIYVGAWRAYLAKQAEERSTPEVKPLADAFGGAR